MPRKISNAIPTQPLHTDVSPTLASTGNAQGTVPPVTIMNTRGRRGASLATVPVASSLTTVQALGTADDTSIPATRSGRRVTMTAKKADAVNDKQEKANAATKKAQVMALCARQANEEASGFVEEDSGIESEEEYANNTISKVNAVNQFTFTPAVGIEEQPRRLRINHRDNTGITDENEEPGSPRQPKPPKRTLVRRAGHVPPGGRIAHIWDNYDDEAVPMAAQSNARERPGTPHPSRHRDVDALPYHEHGQPLTRHGSEDVPAPRSSPASTAKMCTRPETIAIETTHVVKKQKMTMSGSGSRGRLIAGDFSMLEQSLLVVAQRHYRSLIATDWPYPDLTKATTYAKDAWAKACSGKNVSVALTDGLSTLITARGSQLHGEVKSKCCTLVPVLYKLYDATQKADPRETRDKVAVLLQGNSFIFKDPATREGAYMHPIIQSVINETWYANRTDEGIMYAEYFESMVTMERRGECARKGILLMTIALVLTAVQCALDEWITGQRTDIQFTESAYAQKFDAQLTALETFDFKTKDLDLVARIRVNLLKCARSCAKVPETNEGDARLLVNDDYTAARREWELQGVEYDSE